MRGLKVLSRGKEVPEVRGHGRGEDRGYWGNGKGHTTSRLFWVFLCLVWSLDSNMVSTGGL